MKDSISIFIAAYNEEENIGEAVKSVRNGLKAIFNNYEIIIINDGSSDKTGEIISRLRNKDKRIKMITHPHNMGFGWAIRDGIKKASKTYFSGFPGDNDMSWKSFRQIVRRRKSADFVTSYMVNPQKRSFSRRIASRSFVIVINLLFGNNLKYYNGYFVTKTKLIQKLNLKSEGLAIFAEILVKLLRLGASCIEIPFVHTGRKSDCSKAVTLRSVKETLGTIMILLRGV